MEYKTKVFTYDNMVVRVHRPQLDETERTKRMNELKKATARFMKEVEKCEKDST